MQPPVRVELFGGLRIVQGPQSFDRFPSVRSAALVAYLACYPDHPHLREALITLLWPDTDIDTGRVRLRTVLSEARRLLEPGQTPHGSILAANRAIVRLQIDQVAIDATDFRNCLLQAETCNDLNDRTLLLTRAVNLYCGDLLPGFYDEWALCERQRYAHLLAKARQDLALCYEQLNQVSLAIDVLRDLLRANPLSDEANHELVRLLMKSGQIAAAHAQFQIHERLLREEFGIEPPETTRALLSKRITGVHRSSLGPAAESCSVPVLAGSDEAHTDPNPTIPLARPPAATAPISRSYRSRVLIACVLAILCFLSIPALRLHRVTTHALLSSGRGDARRGSQVWAARYSRRAGEQDSESTAVIGDPVGNIYVTGYVQTTSHDADFLTAKYDHNGRELWVQRYNGPGNGVDRARSIALDQEGNVYVTGDSDNGCGLGHSLRSGLDITTIKYSPTGAFVWCRRFNGAANGEDVPCKVVTSRDGGVYVGGYSWGGKTSFDYIVLRYSPDGQLSWARRYDGGALEEDRLTDLAAFPYGGVCVTGFAHGGVKVGADIDYLSIRYDAHGDIQWMGRFVSEQGGNDTARCLAIDPVGNVYVTGSVSRYDLATGGNGSKMVTIKYDPNGVQQWVRQYADNTGRWNTGRAITVDAAGDVVVVGDSYGLLGYPEVAITKFSPSGDLLWAHHYDDVLKSNDNNLSLAVDNHRNIVVVGRTARGSRLSGKGANGATSIVKCTPGGHILWRHDYNGPANGAGSGNAVTTDTIGGTIVTGQSDTGAQQDVMLLKYDS